MQVQINNQLAGALTLARMKQLNTYLWLEQLLNLFPNIWIDKWIRR
jgi:hypothetical protein